jgi:hypothetical protein
MYSIDKDFIAKEKIWLAEVQSRKNSKATPKHDR